MRLLAISDLHLSHPANRAALAGLGSYPDDWLLLAGDIGSLPAHLRQALDLVVPRFAQVVWTPGNHDLWSSSSHPEVTRGEARYDELVALCQSSGVLTPEDEYAAFPGEPDTIVVPMFLLYDYTFRPASIAAAEAVAWAGAAGVRCADERLLDPAPYATRASWCAARIASTRARLDALDRRHRTVLVNHWPLRYDLARPPRIPRFSIWSGTTRTEHWARRFRARAVVSGHLHMRTTLVRDGVIYDEVSLGYPRDWRQDRGVAFYVREILPVHDDRFIPPRDPFRTVI